MSEHVHHDLPARCCSEEPAALVLERLLAHEPVWVGRRLSPAHPEAGNPSLSAGGETREMFEARRAGWEAAVARERAAIAREGT